MSVGVFCSEVLTEKDLRDDTIKKLFSIVVNRLRSVDDQQGDTLKPHI